ASVALLPTLARQFDEPMGDSSMVPTYLVSKVIRREATVALGGDGGDELFGGYPHYSWLQTQERLRRYLPRGLRPFGRAAAARLVPLGVRGRNYLLGLASDPAASVAQFNIYFDADARRQLLSPLGPRTVATQPEAFKMDLACRRSTLLQKATAVDFQTY